MDSRRNRSLFCHHHFSYDRLLLSHLCDKGGKWNSSTYPHPECKYHWSHWDIDVLVVCVSDKCIQWYNHPASFTGQNTRWNHNLRLFHVDLHIKLTCRYYRQAFVCFTWNTVLHILESTENKDVADFHMEYWCCFYGLCITLSSS